MLLARVGATVGRARLTLAPDAKQRIIAAPWPGNVRELLNALERAAILAGSDEIRAEHLELSDGGAMHPARTATATLEEIEREAIEEALAAAGGNRRAAADRLGIGLRTLYDKLKRYRGGSAED